MDWWRRDDLHRDGGRLTFAGHDVEALAAQADGPVFLYSAARVLENAARVRQALAATGMGGELFYAVKANRFAPLLALLADSGLAGADVCSPGELAHALDCGFPEARVSYTGVSVSRLDHEVLARHPRILLNCDSLAMVRQVGERTPGRAIGLRLNPALGVGYGDNDRLRYSGARTTKFGVYREQLDEAVALAARADLRIERVHFHLGCGYLDPQLGAWEEAAAACAAMLDRLPDVTEVNVGGGLGAPHRASDAPLDLDRWSAALARLFGGRGVRLSAEPGDYLVKDAGVLVLEVTGVERKRDTLFVGVDGGFNLHPEPAFYDLPCEPVPCVTRPGAAEPVTVAGNINEALDLWCADKPLPPMREGDRLALLNAGGYGAAMSSDHCMRGRFRERLLR